MRGGAAHGVGRRAFGDVGRKGYDVGEARSVGRRGYDVGWARDSCHLSILAGMEGRA